MIGRFLFLMMFATSILAAVVTIGRANGEPDHGGALALNTCALPCFFGMMPGETALETAIEIVDRLKSGVWSELNNDIFFSILDSRGRRLLVTLDFYPEPVNTLRTIRFSPQDAGAQILRLGDILRIDEQPAVEMRACESTITRITLRHSSGIEFNGALMARGSLEPGAPLIMLDISNIRRPRSPYDANPFGCYQIEGWRGFAPFFSLARHSF
jgi:hypothetical protein